MAAMCLSTLKKSSMSNCPCGVDCISVCPRKDMGLSSIVLEEVLLEGLIC